MSFHNTTFYHILLVWCTGAREEWCMWTKTIEPKSTPRLRSLLPGPVSPHPHPQRHTLVTETWPFRGNWRLAWLFHQPQFCLQMHAPWQRKGFGIHCKHSVYVNQNHKWKSWPFSHTKSLKKNPAPLLRDTERFISIKVTLSTDTTVFIHLKQWTLKQIAKSISASFILQV